MTKLRVLASRVLGLFAKRRREAELSEEIHAHLDLLIEEHVRQGMSRAGARAAARREFGGVDQTKEAYRDIRTFRWMDDGVRDVRFALRTLRRRPLVATVIVLTLALGLGVNIAVFAAVNGILLAPSRFAETDRLVVAWASNPEIARRLNFPDRLPQSPAAYYDYRRETRTIESLAVMRAERLTLTGSSEARMLGAVRVSGNFFATLGVDAALGRSILPEDDRPDAPRVVVLSWGLWQQLGADPALIGRTILIQGFPTTVIGVMPARFDFPRGAEFPLGYAYAATPNVWMPLAFSVQYLASDDRTTKNFVMIGRLAPGATREKAQAELSMINARLQRQYPESDGGWGVRLDPLDADLIAEVRTPLLFLLGAVGLVLLLACANVGNVLMAQASGRRREVVIRTALGAGRWRVIRQLLAESIVLAGLGGAAGVVAAAATLQLFVLLLPPRIPGVDRITLDGLVIAFAIGLSVLTGLLAGLMPALTAVRLDLAAALHDGARTGTGGPSGRRTRNALMVVQTAVAVVLLSSSALLVRSFVKLAAVNPGFSPDGVLAIDLDLGASGGRDATARAQVAAALVERLSAAPGVVSAGAISDLPLNGVEDIEGLVVEGQPPRRPDELLGDQRAVSAGYFETMRIPLVAGRLFSPSDRADGPRIVVINESMARSEWPGQGPIGRRLRPRESSEWWTIVGVVGDVRNAGPRGPLRPQLYQLHAQLPTPTLSLVARVGTGDPAALAQTVRELIHEVDPNQPIARVRPLSALVSNSVASPRFIMALLATFAVLALLLAIVGVYGVTSYVVDQRTREFGLRLALGAEPAALIRRVVVESVQVTGIGLLVGLAGAALVARMVASLLYGVGPGDPVAFAGTVALLLACSLTAAAIPAWRATRVDPTLALRSE